MKTLFFGLEFWSFAFYSVQLNQCLFSFVLNDVENSTQWVRIFFIETEFSFLEKKSRMVTGLTKTSEGKALNRTFNTFPSVLLKCKIFGNQKIGFQMFASYDYSLVYLNKNLMESLVFKCDEYLRFQFQITEPKKGSILDGVAIFPGTKWCGAGNIATNFEDLGINRETDKCCRTHDHCPFYINPGEKKYNLTNSSLLTKSHCDCDTHFYQCLKSVNGKSSNIIGFLFFDIFQMKCFQKQYPIVKCVNYCRTFISKHCQNYLFDTSQNKIYQYFNSRCYYSGNSTIINDYQLILNKHSFIEHVF